MQNAQGSPLCTLHSELFIYMVRSLRQRHRVMMIALAVTLPAAFAAGIATRREVPTYRAGAPGPAVGARNRSELWTRNDLFEKRTIRTRLERIGAGAGQLAVELVSTDQIVRPDVLVYWVPGERKLQDSLPDDAFLLGNFEQSIPGPLSLPEAAAKQTGVLVLYSLADHEIEAVSKPFGAMK